MALPDLRAIVNWDAGSYPTSSNTDFTHFYAEDWAELRGALMLGTIDIFPRTMKLGTTAPTYAESNMYWDSADHTLALQTSDSDVTLQVGQEMHVIGKNTSGSTILNGKAVYISGATGNRPKLDLAKTDADATSQSIGLATADIATGAEGYVTTAGLVRGLNTSAWTAGTALYVSDSTAGDLTSTMPTSPSHVAPIGFVTISHASTGVIMISIKRSSALADLSDVNGTTPLTNYLLQWSVSGYWDAVAGISTALLTSGLLVHERGGLEADVSAYNGLIRIAAGATTNVTNLAGLNTALGSSVADGAHTTSATDLVSGSLDDARLSDNVAKQDSFNDFTNATNAFLGITAGGLVLTAASASGAAGFRVPHGTAPTAPTNGDIWTTTAGAFIRVNGVTKTFTLT